MAYNQREYRPHTKGNGTKILPLNPNWDKKFYHCFGMKKKSLFLNERKNYKGRRPILI